jgi:integrase
MASIRKHPKTGKPQVMYRDPSGRQHGPTFNRLTDARSFKSEVEADLRRGVWRDPNAGRVLLESWAHDVMAGKLNLRPSGKDRDLSHLKNHVLPRFGRCRLDGIRRAEVRSWVRELSENKGLAPRTVRDCYRVLASIMNEAVDEKLITESPCRKIELPRIPQEERRFLSHDEVVRLANAFDARFSALPHTSAIMGLRWGEAAGLKRTHLDLLRRRMLIAGSLERVGNGFRYVSETKTVRSKRLLDMPPPLVKILARHLEHAPASEFVFPAPQGGFLQYHGFRKRFWTPAVERAGFAPLTFHSLRHSCVALLIDRGADIIYVQRFLGHKDVRTTANTYAHLFPQRGREVAEAMGMAMEDALRRARDVDPVLTPFPDLTDRVSGRAL